MNGNQSDYDGPFRKENFSIKGFGNYVTVFQRPGEKPLLDMNFFEGNKTLRHGRALHELLGKAVERAEQWEKE